MTLLVIEFVLLAAVVVIAGTYLTRCADVIGELTGLGRSLAGLILLASATSLPELAIDCTAAWISAPDLAAGDLFGSSLFNLLILAILDLTWRGGGRLISPLVASHALLALASIVLTAIALLFILLPTSLSLWGIGLGPVLIAISYVLFFRLVFIDQRHEIKLTERRVVFSGGSELRRVLWGYLLATTAVFFAAYYLAPVAEQIAVKSGLGETFVGTVLVALTTSMPEIVTTVAAVRMGAPEMAVGNIFGSNAFNMAILLPVDLVYRGGPILLEISSTHTITAVTVIIVSGIALAGMLFRPRKRYWLIDSDAALVVLMIFGAMVLVYYLRGGIEAPIHPG